MKNENTGKTGTFCMVLKGYPRISETFISNEILLLESLGYKIHIVSMRHPRELFTHASVSKIRAGVDYLPSTILPNLHILLYHNLLLALKRPKRYMGALKKAVERWFRTRRSATVKHLLQAGVLVHKFLPGKGIVHFHAHFAHSPTSVALFSSLLSGLPFSFFAHAKDIYTSDRRQLAEKIDMARFVVTCTRYNEQYLATVSPGTATPLFCVYHGINLDYFKPQGTAKVPSIPYRILTVARITEKKGLETVYRALALLRDRGIDFRHTLIGEGDDRDKIVGLIESLDLGGRTTLCGTMTHEQVIDYYAQSDIFVLGCQVAANGDRDGIPNVMAESMAMNLPVVATNVSGLPEFLEDGVTGLMVEPKDPERLSRAMERLLTDQALRQRVTAAARTRVEKNFNNKKLVRELAHIYETMVPELG
ncbi:glucosyl transferase family protein [Desulforapulum autotrophicum HRM2]|uniref:Glucosyl transferase family protein n=1 Tax=Desulforapulum autotrophicum (strain ATCC 43914 / DSM 3382 / VKM B-1955 / HRM2) TaxID=177437 RepID=C0QCZ6_DESAH|nr:glycosyltransferase [Desulforapulum autotrophicum]ACN17228.1 glucosyl transferase family protein [Desulforapulum autotrophicum HRM2]